MRRLVAVLTSILLVVAAGGVHASAGSAKRVEKLTYSSSPDACCFISSNHGAGMVQLVLPAGPERFLSLQLADDSGHDVAFDVYQDDILYGGCSSTTTPIPIRPGMQVTLLLYNGRCPDGRPSIVTDGSLTATFESESEEALTQTAQYSPYTNRVGVWINPQGLLVAEAIFPGGLGSRVSFEIADESGTSVWGEVLQDEVIATFCGATEKPLRINPNYPVAVRINTGPCPGGADLSVVTRGTVTANFSGAIR